MNINIFIYQMDTKCKKQMNIYEKLKLQLSKYNISGEDITDYNCSFNFDISLKHINLVTEVTKVLQKISVQFTKVDDYICVGMNVRF